MLLPCQKQTITAHHVWASADHYVLPAEKQTLTNIFKTSQITISKTTSSIPHVLNMAPPTPSSEPYFPNNWTSLKKTNPEVRWLYHTTTNHQIASWMLVKFSNCIVVFLQLHGFVSPSMGILFLKQTTEASSTSGKISTPAGEKSEKTCHLSSVFLTYKPCVGTLNKLHYITLTP